MSIVFWRLNSANHISSVDAKGKPNGVMVVPADYKPALLPMSPIPSNGGNASDPNFANFDTNCLPLNVGAVKEFSGRVITPPVATPLIREIYIVGFTDG